MEDTGWKREKKQKQSLIYSAYKVDRKLRAGKAEKRGEMAGKQMNRSGNMEKDWSAEKNFRWQEGQRMSKTRNV